MLCARSVWAQYQSCPQTFGQTTANHSARSKADRARPERDVHLTACLDIRASVAHRLRSLELPKCDSKWNRAGC